MNTHPLISRNKREGRYSGFACGSHYREHDVSVHPCLPRSAFAFHRLVEKETNETYRDNVPVHVVLV